MEGGGESRLDGGGPAHVAKADPACQQDLGHRFGVTRPGAMEGSARSLRGRRPMLDETVEVTQQ